MWNIAREDGRGPGLNFDLLTVRCFKRCPLKRVECFLAVMNVTRKCLTWLKFDDGNNDLHIRAGQIGSLQLLTALLRVQIFLSMGQYDKSKAVAATINVLAIVIQSSLLV